MTEKPDRQPYPSETADKVLLRLPDGMRDRLKEAASENGRSLNAEIVQRLQQSLSGPVDAFLADDIEKYISGQRLDVMRLLEKAVQEAVDHSEKMSLVLNFIHRQTAADQARRDEGVDGAKGD